MLHNFPEIYFFKQTRFGNSIANCISLGLTDTWSEVRLGNSIIKKKIFQVNFSGLF